MKKKTIIILSASSVLSIGLLLSTIFAFIPLGKYSKAEKLYANGDYTFAKQMFEKLENFKDSEYKVQMLNAKDLLDEGDIDGAVNLICEIGGKVEVNYQLENGTQDFIETLNKQDSNLYDEQFKVGYHFIDWELLDYSLNLEKDNYSATISLRAIWGANDDTNYIVNHYLQNYEDDDYTLFETYKFEGISDDEIQVYQKSYEGYESTLDQEVSIKPDGTTVVDFYYDRAMISISFECNGGNSIDNLVTKWGTKYEDLPVTQKVGYTFKGWYNNLDLSVQSEKFTKDIKLFASYSPNKDIKYLVKHHLQNYEDDNYTLFKQEEFLGEADSLTLASTLYFEGYLKPTEQYIEILADGSSVVNYYYDRKTIEVNFVSNGGDFIDTITTKWGTKVEDLPITYKNNFTFAGWYIDSNLQNHITEITENTTLYAYFNEEYKPNNFKYKVNNNEITLLSTGLTTIEKLIPTHISGLPVTVIGENAFENVSTETILLPETVLTISSNAFYNANIKNIYLPASINLLKEDAFKNIIGLENVYYSDSVSSWCKVLLENELSNPKSVSKNINFINDNGEYENISNIIIEDFITSIGDYQFYGFDIVSISISENVEYFGKGVLENCNNVQTLKVPFVGSTKDDEHNGYLAYLFGGDSYSLNNEIVPSSLNNIEITNTNKIHNYALYNCDNISEIKLSNKISILGTFAFANTAITNINIPNSVTSIGFGALKYCDLIEITLPFAGSSIGQIGESSNHFGYIFGANTYDENNYYIPDVLKEVTLTFAQEISENAFSGCANVTKINLPSTVKSLKKNAFNGCNALEYIFLPSSIEYMDETIFGNCEDLVIYCNSTKLENWADNWNSSDKPVYYNVTAENFVEIDGVQYILENDEVILANCLNYDNKFYLSENITFNNVEYNVTTIGKEAFINNSLLTEIILTENLKAIEQSAFINCDNLTEIFITNNIGVIGANAFYGCDSLFIYSETSGKLESWHNSWNSSNRPVYYNVNDNTFIEIDEIQYVVDGSNVILTHCLNANETIDVPESITINKITYQVNVLGSYAFYDCDAKTINLPDTLTTIESYAIAYCDDLTKVVIPESVTKIENRAFYNCDSLTIYCYCSQYEARQKWGNNWNYGCTVSYNYTG